MKTKSPQTKSAETIPLPIRQRIRNYQTQHRLLSLAEGVGTAVTVFLALLTVSLLLNRFLILGQAARLILVGVIWTAGLLGLVRFIVVLARRRLSDRAVAFAVGKAEPSLDEKLLTAVELLEATSLYAYKGSAQLLHAPAVQTNGRSAAD